jgi:hypothetical protein
MTKPSVVLFCSLCFSLAACRSAENTRSVTGAGVAPTIIIEPAAATAAEGDSASFSVVASGPTLSYQWYKLGAAIPGATAATYTIASVSAEDAATYYVIVSNGAGNSWSFKRPLHLRPKDRFALVGYHTREAHPAP